MPVRSPLASGLGANVEEVGRATIGDAIRRNSLRHPDKVALIEADTGRSMTYRELNERGDAFALALVDLGIDPGTGGGVAALAATQLEYVVAYVGALKAGARFTGVNTRQLAHEIEWQINDAQPLVLVVDETKADQVREMTPRLSSVKAIVAMGDARSAADWHPLTSLIRHRPNSRPRYLPVCEDDIALLTYTSGTEARPKGVLVSHRNYLIGTTPSLLIDGYISPSAVELLAKPLFTIAGLGSVTSHLLVGATVVLISRVTPVTVLDAVERYRVTTLAQTPTFYVALTHTKEFAQADISSVTQCHTYGGLISRAAIERFSVAAPDVLWASYWGQSELAQLGTIGWFRRFSDVPEGDPRWIGRPTAGLEVDVVDDAGMPAEVGELVCRSPSLMRGYHGRPDLTAAALRGGWLHTGDIVRRSAAGDLFFVDRQKDTIKSGGMNISSLEVEMALLDHPYIVEAAVVGVPDEYWSEAVTAFVVTKTGAAIDPEEVRTFCRNRLAAYKIPKKVVVVTELPHDGQGKIQKKLLRVGAATPEP